MSNPTVKNTLMHVNEMRNRTARKMYLLEQVENNVKQLSELGVAVSLEFEEITKLPKKEAPKKDS